MPTITGLPDRYRFFFYSIDCNEPTHVHVRRDDAECKFWLEPVRIGFNYRFGSIELRRIRNIILEYRPRILETWREHCRSAEK